jgi:hypothetical protein
MDGATNGEYSTRSNNCGISTVGAQDYSDNAVEANHLRAQNSYLDKLVKTLRTENHQMRQKIVTLDLCVREAAAREVQLRATMQQTMHTNSTDMGSSGSGWGARTTATDQGNMVAGHLYNNNGEYNQMLDGMNASAAAAAMNAAFPYGYETPEQTAAAAFASNLAGIREELVMKLKEAGIEERTMNWFLQAEHAQHWDDMRLKCDELLRRNAPNPNNNHPNGAPLSDDHRVKNPNAWLTKYFNLLLAGDTASSSNNSKSMNNNAPPGLANMNANGNLNANNGSNMKLYNDYQHNNPATSYNNAATKLAQAAAAHQQQMAALTRAAQAAAAATHHHHHMTHNGTASGSNPNLNTTAPYGNNNTAPYGSHHLSHHHGNHAAAVASLMQQHQQHNSTNGGKVTPPPPGMGYGHTTSSPAGPHTTFPPPGIVHPNAYHHQPW